MLPALGVSLVKPCVVGTTARASKENVRSIGYSIYYTMVNIGGIALERIGDPAISGVLLGQNLTFLTPGRSSAAGAVVGVGIDWHVVDRVSLFAGAEGTWMSDKSTTAVAKGGVRIGL